MVSKLAVGYHQQRVELGLSVVTGKEQQIDVARQALQTKWSRLFSVAKSFIGRDDICLAIGLLDRQVKGRILLLHAFEKLKMLKSFKD